MNIEQMVLNLNADGVRPWGELTLVEKMDMIGGLLVPESWLENEWGTSPQNRADYDCEATGWDVQKWTTAERSRIRKRRLYSGFANREILGASIDVASKLDNDSTNPSNLNITSSNTHHFGLAAAITEAIVAREWKKLVESGESVDQKLEVLDGRLFKRRIGETNIEAERKEIEVDMTNINDQDISHLLLDTISRLTVLIEGWELDISYNNGHLDSSWISARLDVGQTYDQACSIYQLLQQKIVAVHESQAQY